VTRRDAATIGYLFAFLSAVTGAVRYNLAVFAEPRGIPFIPFLALILCVGVVCSGIHVLVREGAAGFKPLTGRWWHALAYGVLMGFGTLTHFWALNYLNETVLTSLSQASILITIGLAVWLLDERFTRGEWLATIVICSGVFILKPWGGGSVEWRGLLILLAGLTTASLATVGAKRWVLGTPPSVLMFWRNLLALGIVGGHLAVFPEPYTVTPGTIAAVVAAGIMGPYLHGLFFLYALTRIDAAKAALTNRVQPAVVFLLSWTLLDRLPDGRETAAAVFLAVGAFWLASLRARQAAR